MIPFLICAAPVAAAVSGAARSFRFLCWQKRYGADHGCRQYELAEKLLGRSIWTHEFASSELWKELKAAVKPLFIAICFESLPGNPLSLNICVETPDQEAA